MKKIILLLIFLLTSFSLSQTKIHSSSYAQVEPYIAINPTNPNNLLATAILTPQTGLNRVGVYYSTNGGTDWNSNENFTSTSISAGDPVIAFDPDGIGYVVYQVRGDQKIYLRKTTNGGASWVPDLSQPANVVTTGDIDRPSIAISPIRNSSGVFDVYVSFTRLEGDIDPNEVSIALSNNGGDSFSLCYTAPTPPSGYNNHGSSIATGPDGEVFLAWVHEQMTKPHNVEKINVERLTKSGNYLISGSQKYYSVFQIGNFTSPAHFIKSDIRVDSYPRLACDRSPFNRGAIYIFWAGKQSASSTDSDIFLAKGKFVNQVFTWDSSPSTISSGSGEQWMPQPALSPDGVLSLLYESSSTIFYDPIYTKLKYTGDGGGSFSSEINVGSTGGGEDDAFIGDYFGLAGWYGKVYAVFTEGHSDPNYNDKQTYFSSVNTVVNNSLPTSAKKVVVDQLDNSNSSFGEVGRFNQGKYTNYTMPYTFIFDVNSNQNLRAYQDFKTGSHDKFNNWLLDNSPSNPKSFLITTQTNEMNAKAVTSHSGVSIQNNFLEAPNLNPSNDYVQFKDPWLIDSVDASHDNSPANRGNNALFKSRLSPFSPDYSTSFSGDVYKGVFLNQGLVNGQWVPPYYSVQAISPQTIHLSADNKDHTFYFQNWGGSNVTFQYPNSVQTPVVFSNSNATATANLKGTQLSSQTDALAGNGQKKIVKDSNGYLHQVYESLNKVWYERSTDNGSTWQIMNGGLPISDLAKQPSIDFWNATGGPVIAIAYQSYTSSSTNVKLSIFKDGVQQSNTYGLALYSVSSGDEPYFNTRPVVSINPDGKILVAWYVEYYNKVLDMKEFKNSHDLAEQYLKTPYKQ